MPRRLVIPGEPEPSYDELRERLEQLEAFVSNLAQQTAQAFVELDAKATEALSSIDVRVGALEVGGGSWESEFEDDRLLPN